LRSRLLRQRRTRPEREGDEGYFEPISDHVITVTQIEDRDA